MDGSRSLPKRERFLEPGDSPGLQLHGQQPVPKSTKHYQMGFLLINPTSCAELVDDTLEVTETFRKLVVHAVSWFLGRPAPTGRVDAIAFGPQAVRAPWDLAVALHSALTTQIAGPHLHLWW
jgi:hypothetical protein